jgi:hypothetical protein
VTDNESLEYCPVRARHAAWPEERETIIANRNAFLPATSTECPEDPLAQHYLALIDDEVTGYLRINPDGALSLLGSRAANADDITDALLRQAVLDTPRRGFSRLQAPDNHPCRDTLLRLGFTHADEKHNETLSLLLPPDRTTNATGSDLVRLEKIDDFRRFAITLVQQARRSVIIFSEDLEGRLYDNDDFTAAIMEFAHKGRNSNVRLLIRDTRPLMLHGHRLLRASHRASDKITIRKLPTIQSEKHPCYLIIDDNGLLFRQDPQVMAGIGYTDYRARAKPMLEQFEQLWSRSSVDPDLRPQTV